MNDDDPSDPWASDAVQLELLKEFERLITVYRRLNQAAAGRMTVPMDERGASPLLEQFEELGRRAALLFDCTPTTARAIAMELSYKYRARKLN